MDSSTRLLAKIYAVFCLVIVLYPLIFLMPLMPDPEPAFSFGAIRASHSHLGLMALIWLGLGFCAIQLKAADLLGKTWINSAIIAGAIGIALTFVSLMTGLKPVVGVLLFVISSMFLSGAVICRPSTN